IAPAPLLPSPGTAAQRKCPFCAELILSDARKCKHCGEWLDGRQEAPQEPPPDATFVQRRPVVIEKTSKRWKVLMLLGGVGMFIGGVTCCSGNWECGLAAPIVSLLVSVFADIAAWWYHG